MNITPELSRAIELLAEAKMHFLLATHTKPGSPERDREIQMLERCTDRARECIASIGGRDKLPQHLAVALRVCEKGLERLGGPKAPEVQA